jgi:PEGA domain
LNVAVSGCVVRSAFKLSEGTPLNGSPRGLEVDVAPDRAGDVVAALRDLVERLPEHPAIISPTDVGVAGGRPFVVLPTAGEALDTALKAYGPADIADALPRLRCIAEALDVAARHALWHGALTTHSIIIDGDDTRVEGIGVAGALAHCGLTLPLTRLYTAPEVAAGGPGSNAADQYSLAAIAHEWLFGRPIRRSIDAPITLPALPDVDAEALTRAFTKALASDPVDRFEHCTAFVEAIDRACFGVPEFQGSKVPGLQGSKVPRFWAAPLDEVEINPRQNAPEATPVVAERSHGGAGVSRGAIAAMLIGATVVGAVGLWRSGRGGGQRPKTTADGGQVFTDAPVTPQPLAAPPIVTPPTAPAAVKPPPAVKARVVPDAVPASRADAGLLVHSSPAGAAVSIDGVDRGVTPVAIRGLGLGTRTVVVTRAGYRPSQRQITLTPDRPSRTLEVDLVAVAATPAARAAARDAGLVVDSRPAGAAVSIDGRPAGVTPLILPIGPGTYTVRIERAGYRTITTTVEVSPGQRARVAARLEGGQEEE